MNITRWIWCAAVTVVLLPTHLAAQQQAVTPVPSQTEFVTAFESLSNVDFVPEVLAPLRAAPAPIVPQVRGRSGRTYMIAGAAALVGGLLIGEDIGTLIAAGGVVLGVYGIVIYY